MAIPLSQVARLEEFPRSALERVGPQDVVQYRNEILPLIHVSRALRQRRHSKDGRLSSRQRESDAAAARDGDSIQVVVYSGNGRRVGLVVDCILDIVEETLVSRSGAHRHGVLFTAVIQDRVTEFLDMENILGSVDPDLVEPPQTIMAEA
jgi:two-component system chemotaxis sensor kinase CheA